MKIDKDAMNDMLMCSIMQNTILIDVTSGKEIMRTSAKYKLSKGDYLHEDGIIYLITDKVVNGESTTYGCVESKPPFWYNPAR